VDAQLKQQCRQTIYVATLTSVNTFGDGVYGSPAAVLCRCEPDQESADTAVGEELVTRYRIVTEAAINKTDRIWLPGDSQADATLARAVRKVQPCPGETGVIDHYESIV